MSLCKQNHANLPWNQAVLHLRHSNNATKSPCILLLGVYSTDSIGFRDERAGVGGMKVNHGGWKEKMLVNERHAAVGRRDVKC